MLVYAKNLHSKELPIIFNTEHLSLLLGYNQELLLRMSNGTPKFYHQFHIMKHNGKKRTINEPYPTLKEIQSWILENILKKCPVSRFAKAYVPRKTIIDNVKFHRRQKVIIKIDVKNFFDSISYQNILIVFLDMGYNKRLAAMLAHLCCLNDKLPQGAPTSPYLSNLYCRKLDKRISSYCIKAGYRYTRYSDDITISGDLTNHQISRVLNFSSLVLKDYSLEVQKSKTQILRQSTRQVVTGVVVNSKISAGSVVKKELRQSIYYIEKFGLESHLGKISSGQPNYLEKLIGKVNWVLHLEPNNDEFMKYKELLHEIKLNINSN